ncbi:MAG: hypothetical protein AcusKO_35450 [Acuticoccus sp.]
MRSTQRTLAIVTLAAALTAGFASVAGAEQTHMENAVKYLNSAKAELQKANANKGGHRNKAIQLIDEAIQQVRMGKRAAES